MQTFTWLRRSSWFCWPLTQQPHPPSKTCRGHSKALALGSIQAFLLVKLCPSQGFCTCCTLYLEHSFRPTFLDKFHSLFGSLLNHHVFMATSLDIPTEKFSVLFAFIAQTMFTLPFVDEPPVSVSCYGITSIRARILSVFIHQCSDHSSDCFLLQFPDFDHLGNGNSHSRFFRKMKPLILRMTLC